MRLCECKREYVMLLHWGPVRCHPRPKRINILKGSGQAYESY